MPRAFKGSPSHPAVNYLVRLHADIGGKLKDDRKQFERLSEDMKHVEGGGQNCQGNRVKNSSCN
jgi:hypothetical protein